MAWTRPPGGRGQRAGNGPRGRSALVNGAVRSLLVTPWFAASAGIVIAAGLWIYTPHTVLAFPTSRLGDVPCATRGCSSAGSKTGGSLAVSIPGVQLRQKQRRPGQTAKPDAQGQHSASGLTFDFTVLWQRHGKFGAAISVSGRHMPSSWRLTFEMPGTQIGSVIGAKWTAYASGDGGTAAATGERHDGSDGDLTGEHPIGLLLMGTGSASAPTSCTFNGASCTFVNTGPR
jgi:Cellulose binding domain